MPTRISPRTRVIELRSLTGCIRERLPHSISFRYVVLYLVLHALLLGCTQSAPTPVEDGAGPRTKVQLSTDRAAYVPGETVTVALEGTIGPQARVRYQHLGRIVEDLPVAGNRWNWTPPTEDFRGYLAEVYLPDGETEEIVGAIAIDVSSDWTRFPRYGFLSDFTEMSEARIDGVIERLNRHHINGIQFYDWHYKHHRMIPGTPGEPAASWQNIFGDEVQFRTVERYIQSAHARNMKAMFYNLIYGVLEDAASDGVQESWCLYEDPERKARNRHALFEPFVSDIYLVDPANSGWLQYLVGDIANVYASLPFDGFHMDQLGERGQLYDAAGRPLNLVESFGTLLTTVHRSNPARYQVLNAVNQFGQPEIAAAPTSFLYTEVWDPNVTYDDLARIIQENGRLSGGSKNSVIAAYVNYGLADGEGAFNTPSVLFTNAVIFAFGGAHIELGEHMLGKEFFPNDNLAMRPDLTEALVNYYDFLVAYQNLLRDGGTLNQPILSSSSDHPLEPWPGGAGRIAYQGKEVAGRQVIHLLNFTGAATMNWRDDHGIQPYPDTIHEMPLRLAVPQPVRRIWFATPDDRHGAAQQLEFTQHSGEVVFTLPSLEYWSMVVVEY